NRDREKESKKMADIPPPGKSSWPELVFVDSKTAKEIIEKENSYLNIVVIVLAGSPITLDIRDDRVRIFDNIEGVVVETPRIG
ncbi:serine protease inhibitor, partial [Salmonella sp. NW1113]|uniref:serine protease inhibitor n=1 Tax=Salmonella sp. NW1113 TaxID=2947551 RepID=UPI003F46A0E5